MPEKNFKDILASKTAENKHFFCLILSHQLPAAIFTPFCEGESRKDISNNNSSKYIWFGPAAYFFDNLDTLKIFTSRKKLIKEQNICIKK